MDLDEQMKEAATLSVRANKEELIARMTDLSKNKRQADISQMMSNELRREHIMIKNTA